jgi:hypothetical protein
VSMRAALLCAVLFPAGLLAESNPDPPQPSGQNQPDSRATPAANSTLDAGANQEPLTIGEKFKLSWQRSLDPWELFRASVGAGLDQWRDYPSNWGEGWDSFGVRMASHFGEHLIKEEIEFGVEAFDHEDPPHGKSGLSGFWPRTRYAVVRTFVRENDHGHLMPAYSRFVGDYGAGFISREWYPARFQTVGQGLEAGTISLGLDAGMNVLREFWPSRK